MLNIQITHRLFARQLHHVNRSRRRVELACIDLFFYLQTFCFAFQRYICNVTGDLFVFINLKPIFEYLVGCCVITNTVFYLLYNKPYSNLNDQNEKTIMFLAYNDTHTLIKNLYENLCFRALVVYCTK